MIRSVDGAPVATSVVQTLTDLIRHRGPDDEGFLLWQRNLGARVYAGKDTALASRHAHDLIDLPTVDNWQVALGHRRLSIVDLSPAGHQPMVHQPTGLVVTYNGEIYNYLELRQELEGCGHRFVSRTDTEVLLAAWAEWGAACLPRLNGMFAFALLDPRGGGTLHVVRDRFGVKPLYWARVDEVLAFASEIKQLRSLPAFAPRLDRGTVRDYLAAGLLDHTRYTFDENIQQLLGGEHGVVRLDDPQPAIQITRWYELRPRACPSSEVEVRTRFRELLTDSVRLRLRADVPVGSCLSGGLDSSAIVCLAHQVLGEQATHSGQVTVTACFEDKRYDEWRFAEQVVRKTGSRAVRVWPDVDGLRANIDRNLWHMDEPYGSTSQFSQWCVFEGAAKAGLKVMLDGQGSDEQLAGYSGNDAALMTGLLRRGAGARAVREAYSFRRRHGLWPLAQSILAVRTLVPKLDTLLPARLKAASASPEWLKLNAPSHYEAALPRDLNDSLSSQTTSTSLPALLRYEDRNSMAWSIESRVPFLDYRLVEFLAGVPDYMKLRGGVTKRVMRDALSGVLPNDIRDRRDKMGFVTPEEVWLRETATGWFKQGVEATLDRLPDVFHPERVRKVLDSVITGRAPFSFDLWRILCLGLWLNMGTGISRSIAHV